MATLANLKQTLGLDKLELTYQKDDKGVRVIDPETKEPTKWLRHWDNNNRVAYVIHEDTVNKIKANPAMSNLGTKDNGSKETEKGSYHLFTIIAYTEADIVL